MCDQDFLGPCCHKKIICCPRLVKFECCCKEQRQLDCCQRDCPNRCSRDFEERNRFEFFPWRRFFR